MDSWLRQGVDEVTYPGIPSSQMAARSNWISTPIMTMNNMFNLSFVLWYSVGVLAEWRSTLHEQCSSCASFCKAGQEGCCHSGLCCEDTGGKIASMKIEKGLYRKATQPCDFTGLGSETFHFHYMDGVWVEQRVANWKVEEDLNHRRKWQPETPFC